MFSSKNHPNTNFSKILNMQPITSTILPYLEISELPSFALVNTSTAKLIHSLNNSVKFKNNSGISNAILKSLQHDAKQILDNPDAIFSEQDEKLNMALRNVMDGKIDKETLQILQTQKLKYRSTFHNNIYNTAGNTAKAGLDVAGAFLKHTPNVKFGDGIKFAIIMIFLFLIMGLIISVIGGVYQGASYCINECRSRRQQRKLQQRLEFFKDIPNEKEDKGDKKDDHDDKDCKHSI